MVPMKHTWFSLVAAMALVGLLAGCGNVVGPDEFLYTYRTGAVSGAPVAPGGAMYAGRSGDYHVLKLRNTGTPSEWFVNAADSDRTLRCRADQLPSDFPRGFQPLTHDAYESTEDTRTYVQLYLQHSTDQPKRPSQTPIAGNEWTDSR